MKLAKTEDNYKVKQLYNYLKKIYPQAEAISVQYDIYEKSISVKVLDIK
jgi:hypothetical protein